LRDSSRHAHALRAAGQVGWSARDLRRTRAAAAKWQTLRSCADKATTRPSMHGRRLGGSSCDNHLWLVAVAAQPQVDAAQTVTLTYPTLTQSPHQVDLGAGVAARARALVHAPVLGVELVVGQQRHLAKALLRCAPGTQGAVTRAALTGRRSQDGRVRCHRCRRLIRNVNQQLVKECRARRPPGTPPCALRPPALSDSHRCIP